MARREKWHISAKATDNSTGEGNTQLKIMIQSMVAMGSYLLQIRKLKKGLQVQRKGDPALMAHSALPGEVAKHRSHNTSIINSKENKQMDM